MKKSVIVVTFHPEFLKHARPSFAAMFRDLCLLRQEGSDTMWCQARIHSEGSITKDEVPAVVDMLIRYCFMERLCAFASAELMDL